MRLKQTLSILTFSATLIGCTGDPILNVEISESTEEQRKELKSSYPSIKNFIDTLELYCFNPNAPRHLELNPRYIKKARSLNEYVHFYLKKDYINIRFGDLVRHCQFRDSLIARKEFQIVDRHKFYRNADSLYNYFAPFHQKENKFSYIQFDLTGIDISRSPRHIRWQYNFILSSKDIKKVKYKIELAPQINNMLDDPPSTPSEYIFNDQEKYSSGISYSSHSTSYIIFKKDMIVLNDISNNDLLQYSRVNINELELTDGYVSFNITPEILRAPKYPSLLEFYELLYYSYDQLLRSDRNEMLASAEIWNILGLENRARQYYSNFSSVCEMVAIINNI